MEHTIWHVQAYWDFEREEMRVKRTEYSLVGETPKKLKLKGEYRETTIWKADVGVVKERTTHLGFSFYIGDEEQIVPLVKQGIERLKNECSAQIKFYTTRQERLTQLEARIDILGGDGE